MKSNNLKMSNTPENPIVKRIGIFQMGIPRHYRIKIFEKLQSNPNYVFTILSPLQDYAEKLDLLRKELKFPVVGIKIWCFKMPFMTRCITVRPFIFWSLIAKKFDVIIIPDDFLDVSLWLTLIMGRLLARPVCLWGQGKSKNSNSKVAYYLRKIMLILAKAQIFYTEGIREKWIRSGFKADKLFVAYNAIDNEKAFAAKLKITENEIESFQEENGLRNKKIVIFLGRLQKRKKLDVLIHTMQKVYASIPDAHLVIIGDGPVKTDLMELSRHLGIFDKISFAGAVYDENILAKYLLSAKVAVIPAACGLSIQHAFTYGVPVILGDDMSSHGPEAELLTDGKTGVYCRDGDISGFAMAICKLLIGEELREQMSRNALEVIKGKYNIANMAKGFFDAVNYCLK